MIEDPLISSSIRSCLAALQGAVVLPLPEQGSISPFLG
jgi:hypothetical protein